MTTTEMLQVAGSSGLVTTETSPAASELEPYTNLQASLIGKDLYKVEILKVHKAREMLQVAGSSGLVTTETSPAASELEPYTNLQASLIGKDRP